MAKQLPDPPTTDVRYVNRRCEYCGVFEGMLHSPNCSHATPEGRTPFGSASFEGREAEERNKTAAMRAALDKIAHPLRIVIPIPPEVEQYATEIARFVEAMVYKLGVHSKKGKWENLGMPRALELLDGEVKELRDAVTRGNMVEQLLEGADVANYALIIAAKAMEK